MRQTDGNQSKRQCRLEQYLREDYLRFCFSGTIPEAADCKWVNERYCFRFPDGYYFALVLRGIGLDGGRKLLPAQKEQAEGLLREVLDRCPGDFDCLWIQEQLCCIGGMETPPEEIRRQVYSYFETLLHTSEGTCSHWTMGLGSIVQDVSELPDSVETARHALKQCVIHGLGRLYDAGRQSVISQEPLELLTPAEMLGLQRKITELKVQEIPQWIRQLFEAKNEQIQRYPVYAYMLALHLLNTALQILREAMPVDRRTYELTQNYIEGVEALLTMEGLQQHAIDGVTALAHCYEVFQASGKSRPIWFLMSYIQEHYPQRLSLKELAREIDRNPQYVSAAFSRECGISVTEYIASVRIEQAKRLLRTTDVPINEIGRRVGYPDPQYFSRVFHRVTGLYPRRYRQEHQGQSLEHSRSGLRKTATEF